MKDFSAMSDVGNIGGHQSGAYFNLPAEIRNRIMEFVLVPGDVYVDNLVTR